jgi:hypothetical protein
MRKLLIIAAPFAVLASPVAAQTATGTVDITGTVAGRCMFTLPNKTISLGEISLSSNGKLDPSKVNGRSETLEGWCNGIGASMTVTSTELTNVAAAAAGFDKRVDYTATAVTGLASASDTSLVAGAGAPSAVNMFNGVITVTLGSASSPTNGLMVAGGYTGNVVVTLTPTVAP